MSPVAIRPCQLTDLDAIRRLQPAGWDDITTHFRFYCEHPFCFPIVAEQHGQIVAVATGIRNQDTGWLAHIIVAAEGRRQGIGYQVTTYIMDYLQQHGSRTQLLIATDMGEGLYRKLGFRTVTQYQFFRGSQLPPGPDIPQIRPLQAVDLPQILELDQTISGEKRQPILDHFLARGWVYVADSGKIRGYYLCDLGEGLIYATDPEAGRALLQFKYQRQNGKAVLPMENTHGIQFLTEHGFTRYLTGARMILGTDLAWQPTQIYCRAGGNYG